MTVKDFLDVYEYNEYTDPADLYDEEKNEFVGADTLPIKVNGKYYFLDLENTGAVENPIRIASMVLMEDVLYKEIKSISIQMRKDAERGTVDAYPIPSIRTY